MQRIAIIGAGVSGLVTCRTLRDAGFAVTVFEASDGIGGLWRYRGRTDEVCVYGTCSTLSPAGMTGLRAHPFPAGTPTYVPHRQVAAWLHRYADRFGLHPHIRLRQRVSRVRFLPDGVEVTVDGHPPQRFDRLVVCTGLFGHPFVPDLPGRFDGPQIHTGHFREASDYAGQRVLVVGLGNSGGAVAAALAEHTAQTWLATRESAHLMPKWVLGRAFLDFHTPMTERLPFAVRQATTRLLCRIGRGSRRSTGLPRPKRQVLLKNPTVCPEILPHLRSGALRVCAPIARRTPAGAVLADGTELPLDAIVWATGYRIRHPFLPAALVDDPEGVFHTWRLILSTTEPRLAFVGLVDPDGATPPVAEAQAEWLAAVWRGAVALPPRSVQRQQAIRRARALRRRLGRVDGPMVKEPFYTYQRLLRQEVNKSVSPVAPSAAPLRTPRQQEA